MELKIIQNSLGRYNLLGNEESLAFSMAIIGEDGKVITDGTNKASVDYSGDPEEKDEFDDNLEDISFLFGKCLGYSKRVFGSKDREGDCYFFARIFSDNFDEISTAFGAKKRSVLEKKLERIQQELSSNLSLTDARADISQEITKEVRKYEGWVTYSEKELAQLLPDSEKAQKERERIEGYKTKIEKLNSVLTHP